MELSEDRRQTLLVFAAFLALVCFFSSFLLFAYALHIKVTVDSRMALIETYNSDALPGIFVAVGIINLIQNISAIYILLKLRDPEAREDGLKYMIAVLVGGIILVLFEVTSAIVSFVHIGILDDEFRKGIKKAMEEYVKGGELKKEIDGVQMDYECCGDKTYTDWFHHAWLASDLVRVVPGSLKKYTQEGDNYYADDVPFSCCDVRSPRPCIHHHVHEDQLHFSYNHMRETTLYITGCRHVLMDIYGVILLAVGWVAIAIAAVKTCVLLLVRLLQTSLYRAQEMEDWEATTVGYIYFYNPEDAANPTAANESDFSNNASTSTMSSTVDSDTNTDSSSNSWEDMSTTSVSTDSDESTKGAMAAARRSPTKTSKLSTPSPRPTSRKSHRDPSPVKFEVDNLKASVSTNSTIEEFFGDSCGPVTDLESSRVKRGRDRLARGDNVTYDTSELDSPYHQHTQLRQRPLQAGEDFMPRDYQSRERMPRDDKDFMSKGPLSKLRRRSASYLEDDARDNLVERTDEGLLSRIKAHLSGTGPPKRRQGLGGLFASRYKYSRLSTCDPDCGDRASYNANAGSLAGRTKKKKDGPFIESHNLNQVEKLSAYDQTAAFVDEFQEKEGSCYGYETPPDIINSQEHSAVGPILPCTAQLMQSSKHSKTGKNPTQSKSDYFPPFSCFEESDSRYFDKTSTENMTTNPPSLIADSSEEICKEYDVDETDARQHNVRTVRYAKEVSRETGVKNRNMCNILNSEQDFDSSTSSTSKVNLSKSHGKQPHFKDATFETSYAPLSLFKKVWFDVPSDHKSHDNKSSSSIQGRRGTPFPNVAPGLSEEYDLVPTNMRPAHQPCRDLENDSDSRCMTSTTDLDNEVADIISGSSSFVVSGTSQDSQTSNTIQGSESIPKPDLIARKTNPIKTSAQGKQKCQQSEKHKTHTATPSPQLQACEQMLAKIPSKTAITGGRSHIRSCQRLGATNGVSPLSSDLNSVLDKSDSRGKTDVVSELKFPQGKSPNTNNLSSYCSPVNLKFVQNSFSMSNNAKNLTPEQTYVYPKDKDFGPSHLRVSESPSTLHDIVFHQPGDRLSQPSLTERVQCNTTSVRERRTQAPSCTKEPEYAQKEEEGVSEREEYQDHNKFQNCSGLISPFY
ncbi:photoreceptor outer segment membrane glycoprotein 2-like [Plakobranchus ocellatus]|uniref:Photoreceptor outer segment membrane glycoprotein 2-like n=1 Tax=Plakobranchus ocellatus TaxID=259542 RepID=A0AAV4CS57_9GAST|nr:photoreceptor outer segment membrane glycoprotein 2-like [Plakobranchus ocellatus]